MSRTRVFAALVGAVLIFATGVRAETFLMSTDGASSINNPRARSLGQTVTERTIAAIVTSNDLPNFDVVWINPSIPAGGYAALRPAVADGGSLERYVRGGGILLMNVAGNSGSQADIAPGAVDYNRDLIHNANTFAEPDHAYLTGQGIGGVPLNPSMFDNWNFTDHGLFQNLVDGSTVVLENTDGPSWVEYRWGSGTVIITTLTYGWGTGGAREAPLDNLIRYAAVAQGGGTCVYTIKKSKPKRGCDACPVRGDDFRSQSACEEVRDCTKKIKTTIACPEGGGMCKIKAKRRACE